MDEEKIEEIVKVSYVEAVELARKYTFMILTEMEKEHKPLIFQDFYKEKINEINGKGISRTELKLLNSLPSWIRWDKEKSTEIYQEYKKIFEEII